MSFIELAFLHPDCGRFRWLSWWWTCEWRNVPDSVVVVQCVAVVVVRYCGAIQGTEIHVFGD